ncbi:hypothetical protein SEUCBS140593_003316 [Sporothrix eucalyptigena]|uniref:DUF2406 domain-containing protein n=1 Tax=Sporothrix eucalyptigena TaxID=1812306 RepID=A0ABP0BE46_9PEZI
MMATYNNNNAHPLPAAPVGGASMQPPQPVQYAQHHQQQPSQQYQQTPPQMPRRESQASRPKSRSFSFRSDRSQSQKGGPISQKLEPETHAEKEAKRLHSKADPTMAMIEAEPAAVAATVKSSLAPLRSIVHKDNNGNPIAEPDKSNPTRYRWERPLDTIRSFEAAIDGGYNRKSSYPSDNESANFSRRNSYYTQNNNNNARYPQDSYYGRPQSYMPTSNSAYDLRQSLHGRDSYYDQGGYNNGHYNGGGPGYGNNGPRQRYSRIASESQIHGHMGQQNGQNNIYPIPNNHRSYETVASGAGSSGTSGEPAGYQTDPTSSDNSSIERRHSPAKPNMMGPAGMNQGYQGYPGYQNNGYQNGGYNGGPKQASPPIQLSSGPMQQQQPPMNQMGQMQQNGVPMPPAKNVITRKPTNSSQPPQTAAAPAAADKRKSWFSKRFSRQH